MAAGLQEPVVEPVPDIYHPDQAVVACAYGQQGRGRHKTGMHRFLPRIVRDSLQPLLDGSCQFQPRGTGQIFPVGQKLIFVFFKLRGICFRRYEQRDGFHGSSRGFYYHSPGGEKVKEEFTPYPDADSYPHGSSLSGAACYQRGRPQWGYLRWSRGMSGDYGII